MPDFTSSLNKFFKADDLKDGPRTLTIKSVALEEIGPENRRERKPIMRFEEDERGLALNKTRYEDATTFFGSKDTDTWIGKKLTLVYDPNVQFGGKRVGGIAFQAVQA